MKKSIIEFQTIFMMIVVFTASVSSEAQNTEEDGDVTKHAKIDIEHAHTNKLIDSTSPYLLQHAHNPVNWYPWGDEALAAAKEQNKPIFLSIGYSACHWCHVMERESFENELIAAIMNEYFICIKVDREERPDLDEIYMTAVRMMSGGGGWPMSVWLTPELKPFYGGTYYPPEDKYGRPGFGTVLNSIAEAWKNDKAKLLESAAKLTETIQRQVRTGQGSGSTVELTDDILDIAASQVMRTFDPYDGGFGRPPKFPSAPANSFLLRYHLNTGEQEPLDMAIFTLKKMAQGGMFDQLGGGFHRYSVDNKWLVPHFEKMLYDNGQLAQVYLEAYQMTGDEFFKHVAERIFEYIMRDMTDERGGFYSSEDADSEGEEGKFYVWTYDEIKENLSEEEAELFTKYYDVQEGGNFSSREEYHAGQNILNINITPETTASELGLELSEMEKRLVEIRGKLLKVRNKRVRPGLDDKVLTSWNALMISAFAKGYQVLGEQKYIDAAVNAGNFLRKDMSKDGIMLRTYRKGKAHMRGYLDDYAFTAEAYIDLYEATFDIEWLLEADKLVSKMIELFWDNENGGFFFTEAGRSDLITRSKIMDDMAEPSGNSMATSALLRLRILLDKTDYKEKAEQIFGLNVSAMRNVPRAYLKILCALDFYLAQPHEIAIAGDPKNETVNKFLKNIHGNYIPNKVLALINPDDSQSNKLESQIPLLAAKKLIEGKPAVFVCKNFVCKAPVTTTEELMKALKLPQSKAASD